jgi:hypothetical protein
LRTYWRAAERKPSKRSKRKFRFKHKLLSLDATMMPVCLAAFDWALYQSNKGAVKLHLVLDHDGYLPKFAVISDGKNARDRSRPAAAVPGRHLIAATPTFRGG